MEATPVDPLQTIELDFRFLADSTGQSGAALSDIVYAGINYGPVENGDDGTGINPGAGFFGLDSGISDDGGSTAILVAESLTGPLFQAGSELLGTVRIDDLEAGEQVVVRIDVLLACEPGSNPTGNLQGQLDAGRVIAPVQETINTGQQTIPFLKVGEIYGAGEPVLQIEKTVTTQFGTCGVDDVDLLNATAGDTVKYCYSISNPGTADLYDVQVVDDNGTPGNTSDDFIVSISGLANLDGQGDLSDLASGATATGEALVTLSSGGTVINIASASGNNGLSGGNYHVLTAADSATVEVAGIPNQPPVANDDSATTNEDTPVLINAAANDTDPDGNLDPTTASIISGPSNGSLVNNGDGTFSYTPDANFYGTDSFVYEICDTDGLCDQATVYITVAPVNDAPVAADDAYSTAEDTPLNIAAPGVLDNDSDLDGDTLFVDSYTQPANGSVTLNPDGSFEYIPNADFNGIDTFEYTISDGNGGFDTATVTITVSGVNDAPVAMDDNASVDEDGSIDIPVLGNDSDPDGDPLTVTEVSDPPNGTATINPDGTVNYVPDPNFCGQDSFTYTISDGNGGSDTATVFVDVICVNDPPVANDDTAATDEDTPVITPVLDNDSDPDGDPLTVTQVSDPAHGSVVINPDGTVTYTPDPDFNGEDTFTYTACDPSGACDTANVTVVIGALNDPPVAEDDYASTPEDTPLFIDAAANDYDVDGNLDPSTTTVLTPPAHGELINNGDGTFSYTPDPNYNGTDSFVYQICDSDGLCDSATVYIDVTPVNDSPVAADDAYSTAEDTPLFIDAPGVLNNDSDVDGDSLFVDSYTQPANGTVALNPDGSFSYTPNANFNGTDTFEYTISDGNGGYDTATVTITVEPVNDAPVAEDDYYSTDEDTLLSVASPGILGNDYDVDGEALTVSAVNGDAANLGVQLTLDSGALLTVYADGSYDYDPNGQFDYLAVGESAQDSFSYTISDGNGGSDTAMVYITIVGVNDAPVAVDDAYTTQQDTTLTVAASGILGNDYDVDGDILFVDSYDALRQFGGSVVANSDGSFSYTPAPGFAGIDTFTYTISDGNGGYDTATVTITVEARNNRSIAVDLQSFSLSGSRYLSGYFLITNQSGGYDVQITDLAIEVQYRLPGSGGWTYVAVNEGTCSFDPSPLFLVEDQQGVSFSGCELAEEIPDGATVRVTAKVKIFGRFMGQGKADGWFLSRLSH